MDKEWRKVKFAADCEPCSMCGELWCENCKTHYSECDCIGPIEDDCEYEEREDGLYARRIK
jgi:hypothetical protein